MSTSHQHRSPRRAAARVGALVVNAFLVVATLAGLAYLAPSLLGYERYVITGGSMSGTFEKGAIAFEKPVPVDQLEVGDVITYQPPADSGVTTLVTHRIVSVKTLETGALQLRTKGDANADRDPWSFQLTDDTQPVVEHTVPLVGFVFVALADRETRMLAIGVPAGIIALLSLVELTRALREDRSSRTREDDRPATAPPAPAAPVDARPARVLVESR